MIDKDRQELYKTIWGIADELRGSVDGWDFKNYILGFLFYRYISEDFCRFIKNTVNAGDDFDYSKRSDDEEWIENQRDNFINQKGYFIYPSQLFSRALEDIDDDRNNENINEKIRNIFLAIEKTSDQNEGEDHNRSYTNFNGLLSSVDLSDAKIGREVYQRNKNIINIMRGIQRMNFPVNETTSDMFGDAYEYLIGMYSSNAGKSGGEFYTPPEVSELLVAIASCEARKIKTIYDPTCGSGSLLLKFLKVCKNPEDLEFFGQEINLTTCNLCKMNMFLHRLGYEKFIIEHGDTLTDDKFKDRKFDVIVSNPPYSIKWGGKDDPLLLRDARFAKAGALAPKGKADLAFIQHSVHHLNSRGIAAIVCFPGILYREGAEKKIRKWLVDQNYVDAIIQLPENLFYGTSIATCIMVLKNNTKKDPNILFIDATDKFVKAKNRNRLEKNNISQILDLYKNRVDMENYTKLASNDEVAAKEYNLSVATYVVKEEKEEVVDIVRLNESLRETADKINELRVEIEKLIENF